MAKTDITDTEAYKRVQHFQKRYQEAHSRYRHSARALKLRTVNAPTTDEKAKQARAQERERLRQTYLNAHAALRAGLGTQEAVDEAQQALDELDTEHQEEIRALRDEHQILRRERDLIEKQLEEARAALKEEISKAMRPAARKWLDALSAFLEANEALHAEELRLEEADLKALGMKVPITATRDLALFTPGGGRRRLAWGLANTEWANLYPDELAKHPNLTRSPMLAREHAAAVAKEQRLQERHAKRLASDEARQELAEKTIRKNRSHSTIFSRVPL